MSDANPPTQAKEDLREIKLRRPLAADFEALHTLFYRSWMTTWAPHLPKEAVERFQTIDPVRQAIKKLLDEYWLADLNGSIVGVIHVDGACLEDLHVAPEHKGHGIGTYLLSEAERLGARTFDVRAFNDEAIRFYEHRGWVRVRSFMATEMGALVQTHEYRAPNPLVGLTRHRATHEHARRASAERMRILQERTGKMTSGQTPITIRLYEGGDAKFLPEIYRKAVQEIGSASYSADQIAVWSSLAPSESEFRQRAKDGRSVFVAVDKAGRTVGYADLEPDGHIDHIYCAPNVGRKGLGTALALTLEASARSKRLKTLRVEASEIARPVFERLGYRIERKRDLTIAGVEIHNYAMTKPLPKITGTFAPTPATEAYFTDYQSASGDTGVYQVVAFGDSAVMADELASLVLSGQKRATAALLRDFDQGDSMPFVGAHVVLVDGSGKPRAVWQTVEARIGVLENVDSSFAWDEGEGARTRESWLSDHRRYFSRQAENEGFVFDETTAVVFERFQVVWPRP